MGCDLKDYAQMSRKEAEAFLTEFLDEMPESRRRLAETLEQQRCDPSIVEVFTPESLVPKWDCLLPLFSWQSMYVPPAPPHRLYPLTPLEGVGNLDELPSWFATGEGLEQFSPETLWIIDGVGRHFGNVMVQAQGWSWAVGHGPLPGFIYENQPVLLGRDDAWSPLMTTAILVARNLRPERKRAGVRSRVTTPLTPAETYHRWVTATPPELLGY
jgi:hypothetical protein